MGVTDWGEINQPLGAPALGGAGGWADSIAQALNNSDTTVDARLATLEAAMEALIATAQGAADAADVNADGRVAKTGDTMTGPLVLPDGDPAASTGYVDAVGVKASYTPRWHQDGGATLSIGNGSLIGTWERVGDFVHVSIVLLRGSTTNHGSAPYLWDLPILGADYRAITGSAYAFDSSAVTWQPCTVVAISDLTVRLITTDTRQRVGPDVPWGWDVEDSIVLNVEYSV